MCVVVGGSGQDAGRLAALGAGDRPRVAGTSTRASPLDVAESCRPDLNSCTLFRLFGIFSLPSLYVFARKYGWRTQESGCAIWRVLPRLRKQFLSCHVRVKSNSSKHHLHKVFDSKDRRRQFGFSCFFLGILRLGTPELFISFRSSALYCPTISLQPVQSFIIK